MRGCKNTDCFAISRNREVGNTVIICKSCLSEALGDIGEIGPEAKSNIPNRVKTAAPVLFFNAQATGRTAEATSKEAELISRTAFHVPEAADNDEAGRGMDEIFVCEHCGKECASSIGLISHMKACKKKEGEGDERGKDI